MFSPIHSVSCALPQQKKILIIHSFSTLFVTSCWQKLGINWPAANNVSDRVLLTARNSSNPFFMEIFLTTAWEIWNLTNSMIFYNGRPVVRLWIHNFKHQAHLLSVFYRQACSGIPLAVRFVGRDRLLWNSMLQRTQRFRQVRAASCVIPYVMCGGLYCLRC